MALTEKEKQRLILSVRRTREGETGLPLDYRMHIEQVSRSKERVLTSEGAVTVHIFSSLERKENPPLYIYIHGGGFARGRTERDDFFSAYIASSIKGRVLDIDYSLAPEHPYPAAFNECYDVCRWAFSRLSEWGVDRNSVVLGGHSAGANIACAICLRLSKTHEFSFCLLDLNYGCYDFLTPAEEKRGLERSVIPLSLINDFTTSYLDGEMERASDMYVSPLLSSPEELSTFPPVLIITAGEDLFNDEGLDFARALADAGVTVTMRKFEGSRHGFIPQCKDSWQEADRLIISSVLLHTSLLD